MSEILDAGLLTFDVGYYQNEYNDMMAFSTAEARAHFVKYGIDEGRTGAQGGLREEFLASVPRDTLALEIGPFAGPALRGTHVRYADVLSTADLRKRAVELGINPTGCPEIHYVLSDLDLRRIKDRFGAVFSSHCIEHQTDLIRHLQAVEDLLDEHGRYYLIIPDKRYCFDHFLPASTIADVMNAYVKRQTVHELRSVIEHWALTTHNDTERHWNGDHGQARIVESTEPLVKAWRAVEADPTSYIDVHAWQFTPQSFGKALSLLNELGLTTFWPIELHNTARYRNEFCVVLEKTNPYRRGRAVHPGGEASPG